MDLWIGVYNYGFAELCHFVERTLGLVTRRTPGGLSARINSVNNNPLSTSKSTLARSSWAVNRRGVNGVLVNANRGARVVGWRRREHGGLQCGRAD